MSSFHFCLSAARNLSSFQLLPTSLMTDLLQLFLGLPLFLLPWGFHSRAAFGIFPSSFLSVWPIHLSFLFLISKFISSWPVTLHKSLLKMTFGHHILKMYLRHLLTKVCILRRISPVTSHVSHPHKSTDFIQCCHNKHKKFPYRPTHDVSLLSGHASYVWENQGNTKCTKHLHANTAVRLPFKE